jgi:CheY-like chemotaxis protein
MKKVMIIEDDPAILDVLGILFTRAGYIVAAHKNGNFILQNAFEIPDLFVIDNQLSGIEGLEICKHLRSRPETVSLPVILLSASPYLQKQASDAGANVFIEKPFTNKELVQVAANLVEAV